MEIYFGLGLGFFLCLAKIFLFKLAMTAPIGIGKAMHWLHSTSWGLIIVDVILGAAIGHTFGTGNMLGMCALAAFAITSVLYIMILLAFRKTIIWYHNGKSPQKGGFRYVS